MPSGFVSDRPSMSMSSRLTLYVVTTCSYAATIELILVQLSPISVPPWSADQPPNDGMTSPPSPRRLVMSLRYGVGFAVTLRALSPSHASVQEVFDVVSRN